MESIKVGDRLVITQKYTDWRKNHPTTSFVYFGGEREWEAGDVLIVTKVSDFGVAAVFGEIEAFFDHQKIDLWNLHLRIGEILTITPDYVDWYNETHAPRKSGFKAGDQLVVHYISGVTVDAEVENKSGWSYGFQLDVIERFHLRS